MEISVEHTEEIIGGKAYPLTITRQKGLQEIEIGGEKVLVSAVTVFESPLGCSRCCTRANPGQTEEQRAAVIERIRETAVQAMLDQGIW